MAMIVLIAMLRAQKGKVKKLEEILRGMIPAVQNEKGTLKYILHRSRKDPAEFLFYEEYVDQAALDFHGGTSYFKDLGKNLSGLLDGAPKELFYEAVAAIAR
jgi:quinol monooxygenase YgiN